MADFESAPDDFGSYGGGPAESAAPQREKYLHPIAVLFHVLFKAICLIVYCVLTFVPGIRGTENLFIIVFIVTILLAAADFWTVKNVTGRLLCGLRWWNHINPETGESKWSFESRADRSTIHKGEMTLFWGGLGVWTLAWFVFALKNIFSLDFDWLVVDCICLAMALSNMIGYLKCANAARTLTTAATNYAVQYAVSNAAQRVTNPSQSSNVSNDFN
jgi:hypothetical protein